MNSAKVKMLPGGNWSQFRFSLFPALLAIIVYLPAASFDFISLDDNLYLLDNGNIKLGLSLKGLQWAFTTLYTTNWHPLTWLSFLGEYQLFGFNPAGYHMVGVVLHAVNSTLLFLVFRDLTGEKWKSLAVASLFAVHPLNIESVAWIAERKNQLSTLFLFLTVWSYARCVHRSGAMRYPGTTLLFALSLMSKPMAVSLPFLLLLLDYWPLRRFSLPEGGLSWGRWLRTLRHLVLEKIPFFILASLSVVITIYAARTGGAARSLQAFPLSIRIENALLSCFAYLKMLIWPVDLAIYYPYPRDIPYWGVIAAFFFLAAVTGFVVIKTRKYGYLIVGWFWYLMTLLPVIGIVQVGRQAMANRYAYIPFIGVFAMIVWGLDDLFGQTRRFKGIPLVILVVFTGYLGTLSIHELDYWKNSRAAYARALETTKNNHIALVGFGNEMLREGNPVAAENNYREALRLVPDYEVTHCNLGLALLRQGKIGEAEFHLREALKYDPSFDKARRYLSECARQREK